MWSLIFEISRERSLSFVQLKILVARTKAPHENSEVCGLTACCSTDTAGNRILNRKSLRKPVVCVLLTELRIIMKKVLLTTTKHQ